MLGYEFAKKTMELFEKILSSVERNEGLKIFIRMANKENDIDICLEDFFVKKTIEKEIYNRAYKIGWNDACSEIIVPDERSC